MISFADVRRLVRGSWGHHPCCTELRAALVGASQVEDIAVGELTVREAHGTFRIRLDTVRQAGIETLGLDDALGSLGAQPLDDKVLLFHFGTDERVFTVLVHSQSGEKLGCISAPRGRQR